MLIGNARFGTHSFGCGKSQTPVHGIKDMTTHIAQGSRSKTLPSAPVLGMIIFFYEGTFFSYPKPSIPIKAIRNRIFTVRERIFITPAFAAKNPGLRYLANQFTLNPINGRAVIET